MTTTTTTTDAKQEFRDAIATMTATQIVQALKCPPSTANSWKQNRRTPPAWLCTMIVRGLEKKRNASKKS